jgi:hypothetical protein
MNFMVVVLKVGFSRGKCPGESRAAIIGTGLDWRRPRQQKILAIAARMGKNRSTVLLKISWRKPGN